jgi:hypothetical protein
MDKWTWQVQHDGCGKQPEKLSSAPPLAYVNNSHPGNGPNYWPVPGKVHFIIRGNVSLKSHIHLCGGVQGTKELQLAMEPDKDIELQLTKGVSSLGETLKKKDVTEEHEDGEHATEERKGDDWHYSHGLSQAGTRRINK